MKNPSGNKNEEIQTLIQNMEAFNEVTAQLQNSYDELKSRVKKLDLELSDKNEASETTEETTAIVEEKDERTTEKFIINTTASEPAKKIREQQLVSAYQYFLAFLSLLFAVLLPASGRGSTY